MLTARPSNICPLLKKIKFVDCLIFTEGIFVQIMMSRTKADAGQVVHLEEVWVECHKDCGASQIYILTGFDIVKDMLPVFHVTSMITLITNIRIFLLFQNCIYQLLINERVESKCYDQYIIC